MSTMQSQVFYVITGHTHGQILLRAVKHILSDEKHSKVLSHKVCLGFFEIVYKTDAKTPIYKRQ